MADVSCCYGNKKREAIYLTESDLKIIKIRKTCAWSSISTISLILTLIESKGKIIEKVCAIASVDVVTNSKYKIENNGKVVRVSILIGNDGNKKIVSKFELENSEKKIILCAIIKKNEKSVRD